MTLYQDIMNGVYDKDLETIRAAANTRHKIVGQMVAMSTKSGDKVRLIDTIRPIKLRGLIGTVVRREGTKTIVKLEVNDAQKWLIGRYLTGPNKDEVTLPAGLFEPYV